MTTVSSKFALLVLSFLAAALVTGSSETVATAATSTVTVPIAGTVTGAGESVSLSGNAQIVNTLALDPLLGSLPRERLQIKLVGVSGVGLSSGARYVASGEVTLVRLLSISDRVEVAFPFYRDTPNGGSPARSVLAGITLKFNLRNGTMTKAAANFSTPHSAVVG